MSRGLALRLIRSLLLLVQCRCMIIVRRTPCSQFLSLLKTVKKRPVGSPPAPFLPVWRVSSPSLPPLLFPLPRLLYFIWSMSSDPFTRRVTIGSTLNHSRWMLFITLLLHDG
uniref:Secreted protein n=1 Tax=Cacopsylla melanoneura TaxID=428564 RepID=A0A8D8SD66_9HEMI